MAKKAWSIPHVQQQKWEILTYTDANYTTSQLPLDFEVLPNIQSWRNQLEFKETKYRYSHPLVNCSWIHQTHSHHEGKFVDLKFLGWNQCKIKILLGALFWYKLTFFYSVLSCAYFHCCIPLVQQPLWYLNKIYIPIPKTYGNWCLKIWYNLVHYCDSVTKYVQWFRASS